MSLKDIKFVSCVLLMCLLLYKAKLARSQDDLETHLSSTTDFCPRVVERNLTWPRTPPGNWTYSIEYCFTTKGLRLQRKCLGPNWKPPEETCKIQEESNLTPKLLNLNGSSPYVIFNVSEITYKYQKMNALDIFLSMRILDKFATKNAITNTMVNLDKFYKMVDNILSVSRDNLIKSQMDMAALDLWLNFLEKNFEVLGETKKVTEKFAYIPSFLGDSRNVLVNYPFNVSLQPNVTIDEVLNMQNVKSFISVNISIDQIPVNFTVYPKSKWFSDQTTINQGEVSDVFGVYTSYYDGYSFNVSVVYNASDVNEFGKNVSCVSWHHEENMRGFWQVTGKASIDKSLFICTFPVDGPLFAHFAVLFIRKDIPDALFDILTSNNAAATYSKLAEVLDTSQQFEPIDIYTVGLIFKKENNIDDKSLEPLNEIMNSLANIDKNSLRDSQMMFDSTDAILYHLDNILTKGNYSSNSLMIRDNFLTIVNTSLSNFWGFVLLENNTVNILDKFVNAADLLQYENLTSAIVFSPELKKQLESESEVILNVFYNDVLFNEKNKSFDYTPVEKIYNVLLPKSLANFTGHVSTYHMVKQTDLDYVCAYWLYNNPQNIPGSWKRDGMGKKELSLVQCDYNHTTHFGVLILNETKYQDDIILTWITNINCSLSALGYFAIILTAILFKQWRSQVSNKILINFVLSGCLLLVVYFISINVDEDSKDGNLCLFIGILLHYAVMVQFSWMLIIGIFQYRLIVLNQTERIAHVLLKTSLFAWGLSSIPVICVLTMTNQEDGFKAGKSLICYPSSFALYAGVWWPISLSLTINFLICFFVLDSALSRKPRLDVHTRDSDTKYHIQRMILLFFMLGLTWIFGFLAQVAEREEIFIYLFDILATLQGLILFVIYIVFDRNVRQMYSNLFNTWYKRQVAGDSRSSQSEEEPLNSLN